MARVPNDYIYCIYTYTKIKCLYRERIALFGNGRKKKNKLWPSSMESEYIKVAVYVFGRRLLQSSVRLVGVDQTKFRESNNETRHGVTWCPILVVVNRSVCGIFRAPCYVCGAHTLTPNVQIGYTSVCICSRYLQKCKREANNYVD